MDAINIGSIVRFENKVGTVIETIGAQLVVCWTSLRDQAIEVVSVFLVRLFVPSVDLPMDPRTTFHALGAVVAVVSVIAAFTVNIILPWCF